MSVSEERFQRDLQRYKAVGGITSHSWEIYAESHLWSPDQAERFRQFCTENGLPDDGALGGTIK